MNKRIVTRQDVEKLYFQGVREIYVDQNTIILPGAKDAMMAAGITAKVFDGLSKPIEQKVLEYCAKCGIDRELTDKIVEAVMQKVRTREGVDGK
jgi:hypothetical protein